MFVRPSYFTFFLWFSFSLSYCSAYWDGINSCANPPCRYVVYRDEQDNGNILVNDASSHVITWNWEVKGGRWNVTYHYIYPSGWYEGLAEFMNCSNLLDGREQAYVAWGSSKPWSSNGIPIYANAWNISYNGDVFGFVPYGGGRYIFRVFTKNKQHNPFGGGNEPLVAAPGSGSGPCTLSSSDKAQIKEFWQRKRNCHEISFNWSWMGNNGKWHVEYRWNAQTDQINCIVYYAESGRAENMVIKWKLNVPEKEVMYKSNPIKIYNEPAWNIDLNPDEYWGFSPLGDGRWIFQHFSRNLVFQPFGAN